MKDLVNPELGRNSREIRNLDPSSIAGDIDRNLILDFLKSSDKTRTQAFDNLVKVIGTHPDREKVFSFIQSAQSAFENGTPEAYVEAVLNESVLEAFLRRGDSICDYAPVAKLCYVDVDKDESKVETLMEKIQPFINSIDPIKSLLIKLTQEDFIPKDTPEAHANNALAAWHRSSELLEALYRVSGDTEDEAKNKTKKIIEAGPDSNLGALNNYSGVLRLGRKALDSLEAIVMGPSFDPDHPRHAPEFCLVMNFHEDLDSLGSLKRQQMQKKTKIANFTLCLKKKGVLVPPGLDYDQVFQLYLSHYDPKGFDPYMSINTILYPDPYRIYTEEEKEDFFKRLDDMLSR